MTTGCHILIKQLLLHSVLISFNILELEDLSSVFEIYNYRIQFESCVHVRMCHVSILTSTLSHKSLRNIVYTYLN